MDWHYFVNLNPNYSFMKSLCILLLAILGTINAFAQCPTGNLFFHNQQQLNEFALTYPDCAVISNDLLIDGATISDLSPLSRITTVVGSISVEGINALTNLSGLNSLTSVGRDLKIGTCTSLTSLIGLNELKRVGGTLYLESNTALTSLNDLSELNSTEELYISNNNVLSSLDGLGKLNTVGYLTLYGNRALSSLSGLTNSTIRRGMTIFSNISLSNCAVAPICHFLAASAAGILIMSNNGTGDCNTPDEVRSKCSALPVALAEFTLSSEATTTQLSWTTSWEKNADRFEIEHSLNAVDWHTLGQVMALGSSESLRHYDFTHADPADGLNYYRLKLIDRDATYAYSSIRSVRFRLVTTTRVYPNPTADVLQIEVAHPQDVLRIGLYDRSGKLLSTVSRLPAEGINVARLPPGQYVLRIHYANTSLSSHSFIRP